MAREKTFSYTVKGHWPFPLDMLRHDCSRAATDADQETIDRYSADCTNDGAEFADVEISLIGPCKPNTARWESFGWSVPSDTEYADNKRWEAEARERKALAQTALAKLSPAEREAVIAESGWRF